MGNGRCQWIYTKQVVEVFPVRTAKGVIMACSGCRDEIRGLGLGEVPEPIKKFESWEID